MSRLEVHSAAISAAEVRGVSEREITLGALHARVDLGRAGRPAAQVVHAGCRQSCGARGDGIGSGGGGPHACCDGRGLLRRMRWIFHPSRCATLRSGAMAPTQCFRRAWLGIQKSAIQTLTRLGRVDGAPATRLVLAPLTIIHAAPAAPGYGGVQELIKRPSISARMEATTAASRAEAAEAAGAREFGEQKAGSNGRAGRWKSRVCAASLGQMRPLDGGRVQGVRQGRRESSRHAGIRANGAGFIRDDPDACDNIRGSDRYLWWMKRHRAIKELELDAAEAAIAIAALRRVVHRPPVAAMAHAIGSWHAGLVGIAAILRQHVVSDNNRRREALVLVQRDRSCRQKVEAELGEAVRRVAETGPTKAVRFGGQHRRSSSVVKNFLPAIDTFGAPRPTPGSVRMELHGRAEHEKARAMGMPLSPFQTELALRTRTRINALFEDHPEFDAAWRQCSSVLRDACAKAPFGDARPSLQAPYSADQLQTWALSCETSNYRLPTVDELVILTRATVLHIAAVNRERLAQHLQSLISTEASLIPSGPLWLTKLSGRYGSQSLLHQLEELPRPLLHDEPFNLDLSAIFAPLNRLAGREHSWRSLIALIRKTECAGATLLSFREPVATRASRRVVHNLEGVIESSLHEGACPTFLASDAALSMALTTPICHRRDRVSDADQAFHVQLRVRLLCTAGGPVSVGRITIAEDLGAMDERSALEADIVDIAKRDVEFVPPVRLNGPGSFFLYSLKMPAAANEVHAPSFRLFAVVVEDVE